MNSDPMTVFDKLLRFLCVRARRSTSKVNIVQIGANDGRISDPIYESAMRYSDVTGLLLIEPQNDIIQFLSKNYQFHSDVTIWNGAIGSTNGLTFYRLKPEYYGVFKRRYLEDSPLYRVPTGFTSTVYEHVFRHISGNLPEEINPQDAIELVSYQSAPLQEVIAHVGWGARLVDVIQIDAEGSDDDVVYASNLPHLRPALVNFEYKHLPPPRRVGLSRYLGSLGFRLKTYDDSNAVAINQGWAQRSGVELK